MLNPNTQCPHEALRAETYKIKTKVRKFNLNKEIKKLKDFEVLPSKCHKATRFEA